jgi:hypothetical protein
MFGKILGQHRDSTASQIVRFSQEPFCLTMGFSRCAQSLNTPSGIRSSLQAGRVGRERCRGPHRGPHRFAKAARSAHPAWLNEPIRDHL